MYLFDTHQVVRAAIVDGVTELIHHEKNHTIDATIPAEYKAENGEYLGFECVDGRWRLFCINDVETDDAKGVDYIKALDAAVDDLTYINVQDARQETVTPRQAVETLLNGTEWAIGNVTTGNDTYTTDAEWESLWNALQTVEKVCDVRVVPYYTIENGVITAKRVDVLKKEPVFRGCFLEEKLAPANIKITRSGRPVTVMYGLGKAMGTGEKAERLTMADAEWSKAKGDPADKPKGQLWVEDAEATARYGRREQRVLLNDVEKPAELTQKTWEALQENKKPKANVEATFQDMEQLKGEEYRKVRIGDEAMVRTRENELISTTIYDIDRDYVKPELSKVKSGREEATATAQVAGLIRSTIHTQETLTVYRNKFLHDEALIQLNANTILANAEKIRMQANELLVIAGKFDLQASEIINLQTGVGENAAAIVLANGRINANANAIDVAARDIVTIQAGVGENAAGIAIANGQITALANDILLKADKIDLLGYVTASQLETNYAKIADLNSVQAQITNLTGGLVTASVLRSTLFTGNQANFTFLTSDAFNLGNELVQKRSITMGEVTSTGKALAIGELDLDHSHEVTVDDKGNLKLGGVAADGGNFNIAETQFYKDGVSASYADGYEVGFDRAENAYKPTNVSRTDYSAADKTVTVKVGNAYQDLLTDKVIDASEIYKAGHDDGYDDGYAAGWAAAKAKIELVEYNINGPGAKIDTQERLYQITADGSLNGIRNTAANYFFVDGYANAYVNGTMVNSQYISKANTISVGQ